jgi:cysteine-rich repeat protein
VPPEPACGDSVIDPGESCDDGNTSSGDGCSHTCFVDDQADGTDCSAHGELSCASRACDATESPAACEPADTCGNGTVEETEVCDDGNTFSGDGCSATCFVDAQEVGSDCSAQGAESCASGVCDTNEIPATCKPAGTCGNGTVEETEVCDDGNTSSGDGCSATCFVDGQGVGSDCSAQGALSCASGVCDANETPATCEPADTCGNGTIEGVEACDDGNVSEGDSCNAACAGPSCVVTNTHATIQDAVDDGACTHVFVPAGTYEEAVLVNRDVIVRGEGALSTTVDGTGGRAMTIASGTVLLSGLLLTDGLADQGGGLHNQGSVTLIDVRIAGNRASEQGGGIYSGPGSELTLDGVVIDDNRASGSSEAAGGGLYLENSTTFVTNSVVSDNSARGRSGQSGRMARGSGVFVSGGDLVLDSSRIEGNWAIGGDASGDFSGAGSAQGGGLHLTDAIVVITNSSVSGNLVRGGLGPVGGGFASGGGILVEGGELIVEGTTIDSNLAEGMTGRFKAGAGGGLKLLLDARFIAVNSTISGNSADFGEALEQRLGASAAFYNTTIAFNSTEDDRSALLIYDGEVTLKHTIVANAGRCVGSVVSQGYNVLGPNFGCAVEGDTTGDQTAVDPQLQPLADNGGPTMTHAISETSPALDMGDPAGCGGEDGVAFTTDQRGMARPVGVCDIGAFERQ